jgi:hypothetical protein
LVVPVPVSISQLFSDVSRLIVSGSVVNYCGGTNDAEMASSITSMT